MTYSLRVRQMIAAALVALALTMAAAAPIVTDIAGFGGTASADECQDIGC
ncbi:MAG: hypothetical protein KDJ52_20830 [Anaerolineae bacterium]|nr:hypothetical protein [Anaerolineae bacterium]